MSVLHSNIQSQKSTPSVATMAVKNKKHARDVMEKKTF